MASVENTSLKDQPNTKIKESNKLPSITITYPNELWNEKIFILPVNVSLSNLDVTEEHLLRIEREQIESTQNFFLSEDLKVPFSCPILDEERCLLDKELFNQILYKMEQVEVLTKKEEKVKNLIQRLRLEISSNNRIKNSDITKIKEHLIPLGKQDQLLRLCNDFNFYSENVQFYPKSTMVKCDKSDNSFEAESIHISSSFTVIDNNDIARKEQNNRIVKEKLKKISSLMLILGEIFKKKLNEWISLTEQEMKEDINPKIQSIQQEFFKGIESICKQSNKIQI